jgi:hypothetical protein
MSAICSPTVVVGEIGDGACGKNERAYESSSLEPILGIRIGNSPPIGADEDRTSAAARGAKGGLRGDSGASVSSDEDAE